MNAPELDVSLVLSEMRAIIADQAQQIAILKATLVTVQGTFQEPKDIKG